MPEILTKHPDIVIKLLQEHGIECSKGAQQQILTKCPQEHFCSLKGGELCVYGLDQFDQMTQIKKEDICKPERSPQVTGTYFLCFFAGFFVSFVFLRKKRRS